MLEDLLPTSTRRERSALWTGLYLRLSDEEDDQRAGRRSSETSAPDAERPEGE